jgi:cyclic pyranopterin phosphate synthase
MIAALGESLPLPVLDTSVQRPVYAQGPRSMAGVRLLRISVTDRCNLRCVYCMPEEGVSFYQKADLLGPADLEAVASVALGLGVSHLKITGGEPTIRTDIIEIASRLAALEPRDLSLTTNGLHLHRLALPLRAAGVHRLTLSLDSLRPDRYQRITGGGRLDLFWQGVDAAIGAGFTALKINVVVMRGVNDDEVAALAAMSIEHPWTVRFIEYMPLGDSRLTAPGVDPDDAIVDNQVVRQRIEEAHGPLAPVERRLEAGVGPASVFHSRRARAHRLHQRHEPPVLRNLQPPAPHVARRAAQLPLRRRRGRPASGAPAAPRSRAARPPLRRVRCAQAPGPLQPRQPRHEPARRLSGTVRDDGHGSRRRTRPAPRRRPRQNQARPGLLLLGDLAAAC